ncbi:MAG: flagellar brake protein [Betaproteobacteria bacterium]
MTILENDSSDGADDGKFRVHEPMEIASILRAIMRSGALVTAYFDNSREFIVTAILDVETDLTHLIIDSGSNATLNDKLVRGQELTILSSQDGVKIEFDVQQVEATSFEDRLAFRIGFPETLLKLQRREYFRLPVPLLKPLRCRIPIPPEGSADAIIGDISLGGVSVMGEYPGLVMDGGAIFAGCRIALPDVGTLNTGLQVCNSFPITLRNGSILRRTGCAFVDLPANQEAMLQRYIIRLERDRRAKSAES